jgi:hypothetical protein
MSDPDDDPNGGTRALTIGFGASKSFEVESHLSSYEVQGQVNQLTRLIAELGPTGQGWP